MNDPWSFSWLFAIFFCGIEETGNLFFFFRNLHFLSFPTIYSLPCFPLKRRAYEFFPRGHPRRSGVTLSRINFKYLSKTSFFSYITCKVSYDVKFTSGMVKYLYLNTVFQKLGKAEHWVKQEDETWFPVMSDFSRGMTMNKTLYCIDCLQSVFSLNVRRVFNPKQAGSQKVAAKREEIRLIGLFLSQSFSPYTSNFVSSVSSSVCSKDKRERNGLQAVYIFYYSFLHYKTN